MAFRANFDAFFARKTQAGFRPSRDDEQKRHEISRKDAKSFSYPQPLVYPSLL